MTKALSSLSNRRFGSETRRDETRRDETRRDETRRDDARHGATRGMALEEEEAFYDELERAYIAELEHVRAGGVDLTEAILREEVYERLIGELEREDVSSDARDSVASFLQDLRRDGVDWHSVGDGSRYLGADDKERFFRTVFAGACARAARTGLECLKFAHEHGAPWDRFTCCIAAANGHLECLKYACERGCPDSARYAEALREIVIPDADERFGVGVALAFQQNGGEISMREFLPLWVEHRELYRDAHLEVARNLSTSS